VTTVGPVLFSSQVPGSQAPTGPSDAWALNIATQVVLNGVADLTTTNAVQLYYHNHYVYYEKTDLAPNPAVPRAPPGLSWYRWDGTSWNLTDSPLVGAGQPVARLGDRSSHGGVIINGSTTVFADGIGATRQGHMHSCPIQGHGITALSSSSRTSVDGLPRVRVGDVAGCGAVIIQGSPHTSAD